MSASRSKADVARRLRFTARRLGVLAVLASNLQPALFLPPRSTAARACQASARKAASRRDIPFHAPHRQWLHRPPALPERFRKIQYDYGNIAVDVMRRGSGRV
jgi:hypothetical protein